MGSDDLFHKRKARKTGRLKRRKARRAPYAKVLIVCEGEKTEPSYFKGLNDHYGLNSANVEINGEGKDPLGIYHYAKRRFGEEKAAGDPFDHVYCVFDKDTHAHYADAVSTIEQAVPADTFYAITSVPCFEYWLLLHFIASTKPYAGTPDKSAGKQVETELRNYIPDYAKGHQGIFAKLVSQLDFAKANAARTLAIAGGNGTDNPSTHVHELVTFLQQIK